MAAYGEIPMTVDMLVVGSLLTISTLHDQPRDRTTGDTSATQRRF
jgi:hypothetical protein